MASSITMDDKARFDTRLSKDQKSLFEKAAQLGGFRNLTDFVISTLQKRSKEIIEENEKIIASQKDSEIFFDALTNEYLPNEKLSQAAEDYKKMMSE